MNGHGKYKGSVAASVLILIVWMGGCAYALDYAVVSYSNYDFFQKNARFIGLAIAATSFLFVSLFNHLRDFRKKLEENSDLSRREVANLNELASIGYKKSIGMMLVIPAIVITMSMSVFVDLKVEIFKTYVYVCGAMIGLVLACTYIAITNLIELDRFEKKLSNRAKQRKSSSDALKKFKDH